MSAIGRKTLKSVRARGKRIDVVFERIGYAVILFFFIFTISAWLSYRESLRISHIEIVGVHAVDPEKVSSIVLDELKSKLLFKIDRDNALLYPKNEIIRNIYLLNGRVKSVDAEMSSRKNLVISVNEYAPELLACPNMSTSTPESAMVCYFADDEGYIFAPAPVYSGYFFPMFVTHDVSLNDQNTIGTHILPPAEFSAIQNFLEALRNAGFTPKQIDYLGEHDYEIITERPWVIRWSSTVPPSDSINNLRLVLRAIEGDKAGATTLQIIDLRFGNKVFYR